MRVHLIGLAMLTIAACVSGVTALSAERATGSGKKGGAAHGWHAVAGTGVHYFTTAIVHSSTPTARGKIERTTETIDLAGDLTGRVLYHPTSVYDFAAGTLVNTGHQVFSGTVLGVGPVMIGDRSFRFEVNLQTGATTGKVHLNIPLVGMPVWCHLDVVGTG